MNIWIISMLIFMLKLIAPPGDEPIATEVNNRLARYSWDHPTEKVYLHTDKSYYVTGEDIWYKVYLMIGPYHVPDSITSVVYVDLIDPEGNLSDRKIIRTREGLGWGDFDLPGNIKTGAYILKAYTRYMQNFDPAFFFRKTIQILPVLPENRLQEPVGDTSSTLKDGSIEMPPVKVQFFPEGGELVTGLQNYVAFKATDLQGKSLEVKGVIKDSNGLVITEFESQKFGMGYFILKPEENEKYRAILKLDEDEYSFDLPVALARGYGLHVNKSGKNIYLWVRNNQHAKMDGSFVIGQFRGFPFITIHAKKGQEFLYSVLSAQEIPSGIIHFTFFDSLGIPRCERLVYTENEKETIDFRIGSDQETYKKRDKASFDIHIEDLAGNPVLTNLSLSVVNDSIVKPDPNRSHIKSYFNLESDLKGNIENPGYYFNPDHTDRFELLDILMLTHGWRRFVWKEILEEQSPALQFQPESGFNISGNLVNFYNPNKKQPGKVRVFIYENQLYYNEIETDNQGHFEFQGLTIFDSTDVVMQAWREMDNSRRGKKNKDPRTKNDLTIRINDRIFPEIRPEFWPPDKRLEQGISDYLALNDYILKIDSSYDGRTIIMEELTVQDRRINPEDLFDRPGKLYNNPSRRVVMDSIGFNNQSLPLVDILRMYMPGIQIRGVPPNVQITIRGPRSLISGTNQPMFLLDGMPAEIDFLYYFPTSEIAFIDLLNSSRAAIYGSDGANGVIAVYTRQEPAYLEEEERKGMTNFIYAGYYRAREFYTPDYEVPEEKHIKPDFRRTLYWNPSLTTDDLGNIEFSFFTSDETGDYRAEIEGMTYSGIPFTRTYHFSVE